MAEYIEREAAINSLIGWETEPTDEEIEYTLKKIPAADVAMEIAYARAEAITEFAERLKKFYGHLGGKTVGGSVEYHINQVLKEMQGKLGADTCVCCGDAIPEGRQVCPQCEGKDDDLSQSVECSPKR